METETLEQERLLVYEHTQEIQRITQELQTRLNILQRLNDARLSPDEIKNVTTSQAAIDQFIFDLQLKGNKELAKLHKAGINVPAELPANLQQLKYDLQAWNIYTTQTRGGNKFSGLVHNGDGWDIDPSQLENHLVMQGLKVYVEGERLQEFRDYESLAAIVSKYQMYSGQVHASPWLSERIENSPEGYRVKGSFFRPR